MVIYFSHIFLPEASLHYNTLSYQHRRTLYASQPWGFGFWALVTFLHMETQTYSQYKSCHFFLGHKNQISFFLQKERKLKKESCSISLSWFFQATSMSHGLVLSFREIIWGHPHSTNLWTTWTDAVTHQPKHTYRHTQTRPSCAPHIHKQWHKYAHTQRLQKSRLMWSSPTWAPFTGSMIR